MGTRGLAGCHRIRLARAPRPHRSCGTPATAKALQLPPSQAPGSGTIRRGPLPSRSRRSRLRPALRSERGRFVRVLLALQPSWHTKRLRRVVRSMNPRTGPDAGGAWTREPTYPKPGISVRATTSYYEVMAPLMLPFIERRLLNLFRCREQRCYFQRSRAHPPSGHEFEAPVKFEPVEQKNGRTEVYLYVADAGGIVACAKVQTVEFHGWGSRAGSVETPDRLVIDLDPGEGVTFEDVKHAALQVRRALDAVGLRSFPLLTGGKGIHVVVPLIAEAEWREVREFAKLFCTALAEA